MPDGITSKRKVPEDLTFEAPVRIGFVELRAGIVIGRHSYINDGLVHAGTKIGRFCSIGRRVTIGAGSHPMSALTTSPFFSKMRNGATLRQQMPHRRPAEIGHDIWIGDNTVIMRSVRIGHGAIIGASAVVTKDVPAYAVVGGVPARVLKMRFPDHVIAGLLETEWWNYPDDVIVNLPVDDPAACVEHLKATNASKAPFAPLGY